MVEMAPQTRTRGNNHENENGGTNNGEKCGEPGTKQKPEGFDRVGCPNGGPFEDGH